MEREVNIAEEGIAAYNKLIGIAGGDSVRLDHLGKKAEGWVEDHYMNGKTMHKGFYKMGQLTMFRNFFENGNCERNFTTENPLQYKIEFYYANGNLRKSVEYFDGKPRKVREYYENGNPKSCIEFDKEQEQLISKKTWFNNGSMESEVKLTDKNALRYNEKHYYSSGVLKEEGSLVYSKTKKDFVKYGTWLSYETNGRQKQLVKHH